MKFLLLVCWDAEKMNELEEPDGSEAEDQDGFPWLDELQARGAWVIGDQLAPPRRARSVRVRNGKSIVSDGPFAETKEVIGGYFLADCKDLDQAIELAERVPLVGRGSVEIRPVVTQ